MKALSILPILMYTLSVLLFAQKPITGQVTDGSDGSPVPYVTIGIRDSNIGTVSDENGVFRLVLLEKSVIGNTVMCDDFLAVISYSSRKLSTGLAVATLTARSETVINAMASTIQTVKTNIHQPISIR